MWLWKAMTPYMVKTHCGWWYANIEPGGSTHQGMASHTVCILFHHALQWRYNERDDVSNHRRLDWLFNRLFRCRTQKISMLRVTAWPLWGESPVNAENVGIWWRHHGFRQCFVDCKAPSLDPRQCWLIIPPRRPTGGMGMVSVRRSVRPSGVSDHYLEK